MLENTINLVNGWAKALESPTFIAIIQEEDWTIIPVNVFKNGQKSHEVETGIMTFCEHIETENGNCLKCGEWQDC